MTKKFVTAVIVLAVPLALAAAAWSVRSVAAEGKTATITSVFKVDGMTCGGCEVGVEMKVGKLDGVERVEASYRDGTTEVAYDPGKVMPETIAAAIEELGYSAELLESTDGEKTTTRNPLAGLLDCC